MRLHRDGNTAESSGLSTQQRLAAGPGCLLSRVIRLGRHCTVRPRTVRYNRCLSSGRDGCRLTHISRSRAFARCTASRTMPSSSRCGCRLMLFPVVALSRRAASCASLISFPCDCHQVHAETPWKQLIVLGKCFPRFWGRSQMST